MSLRGAISVRRAAREAENQAVPLVWGLPPRSHTGMRDRAVLAAERSPAALAELIQQRHRLLDGMAHRPEWRIAEAGLARRLRSILAVDGLELVRIDRHSPQALLDQIVSYEAVHPIRDGRDLERRLGDDRRCYAFVHPLLPDEPLIFTELALTGAMSANVEALLDPDSPVIGRDAWRAAIFYSISSCHEGLRGIPLGNALIARVARELSRTLPALDTFATLSPVPGFRAWLAEVARAGDVDLPSSKTMETIAAVDRPDWHLDRRLALSLQRPLLRLCAYYLLHVTRNGEPADAVARFHLRNGARLERINWLSDRSPAGIRRSGGLMVNYLYRRRTPRGGFDAFTTRRRTTASRRVERLACEATVAPR
jgi:malonyl-CoA decarboxylase